MRSSTRRIVSAAVGAALLVSGCSSGDDDTAPATTDAPAASTAPTAPETSPATTSAPSTTAAPTTTTAATTTTTSAPPTTVTTTTTPATTAPPPTTNPGDPNWVEVVQGLLDLQYELREEPDTTRIEEFCVGGESACQAAQGLEIRRLAEEGWRALNAPEPEVLAARLLATAGDAPATEAVWVLLEVETVRKDQTGGAIVDQDGDVVFELTNSGDSPTVLAKFMLASGGSKEWRVMAIEEIPVP